MVYLQIHLYNIGMCHYNYQHENRASPTEGLIGGEDVGAGVCPEGGLMAGPRVGAEQSGFMQQGLVKSAIMRHPGAMFGYFGHLQYRKHSQCAFDHANCNHITESTLITSFKK